MVSRLLNWVASLAVAIAMLEPVITCTGLSYQPEVPQELLD